MKAIPEARYQKEVFRTGMISGNPNSLPLGLGSLRIRRYKDKHHSLLNKNTGYVIFCFTVEVSPEPTKPDYAEGHFFLHLMNKIFKSYDALIKGAYHPHFLNIHISHIMRTSMCGRHL